MSNFPGTYFPPLVPNAAPPRRTYGKKRILDPELLDIRDLDLPSKKSRKLAPLPVNASKSSPLSKRVELLTSSPIKRIAQDQNALDSPFLEPRSKLKRGMLRRTSSTRKPPSVQPPKPITSRHFSLNQNQNQFKNLKPMHQDELRRKTSEATTTVSVSAYGNQSWLVPPPPRSRATRTRYMSSGEVDFSFNPPAESTLHQGSPTPRVHMHQHRKRHDSILSTDSDDDGNTISVTRLFGAPPLPPKIKPKPRQSIDLDVDEDSTPRALPLIEQLCRPRSGSVNATIRPLNMSFRQNDVMDADDEMDANRQPPVKRPDPALGALADACASMGLDEQDRSNPPGPSSPTNRPAKRHRKTRSVPGPGHSSTHRLSPGAVHRLSQWPRVGMRIEAKALSPNEDSDMFATYDFDKGIMDYSE
ncbi:Sly41p [Rhizoctonia solani AG-3 Rhs1AP]|uniref:Sly41p n=2 Tax=Rhizoctonia solani AG-3 TaxID=1086053 RepID=A0A074S3D0_9AGAM|nr:Sly41p [Rhizoctonia solani AG-3 Rhs1AP]KEP51393.1 Sly41p [Rhizoctonia solani 123E]